MRTGAIILAAVLALMASSASAQTSTPTRTPTPRVILATGFEFCADDTYFWDGDALGAVVGGGTVTRTTPVPNSDTGNKCLLSCTVASAGNCGRSFNFSLASTLGIHLSLNVTAAPSTARRIARFYNSSTGQVGGFLMIVASGTTGYRLKPYFLDTVTECSGSNNNGSTCDTSPTPTPVGTSPTPTPRCLSAQVGEAQCGDAAYAQPALVFGTSYKIAFGQAINIDGAGAGAVKLELWADGAQLGARTKPQGTCAGGTKATFACKLDADCPSSTCTTTDIVTYDRVVFGLDDSAAGAATYTMDDVVVQTNILSVVKARIEPIYPDGGGSITDGWGSGDGCSSPYTACVDDLAASPWLDDNDTYIQTIGASFERSWTASNIGALGSGESIIGLAVTAVGVQPTTASADKNVGSGFFDIAQNIGSTVDYFGFGDTSYHAAPYSFRTSQTGGTQWIESGVNAIELEVTSSAGSTGTKRVSALVGEVAIQQPRPGIPSTLSDKNADGEITVAYDGDSRMLDDELASAFSGLLRQPDNIYHCSEGARTTLDVYNKITSIMAGAAPCVAWKGLTGRVPDYIFHGIGVNSGFHRQPNFPRAGRCFDNGGANDGAICYAGVEASFDSAPTSYCLRGAAWRTACNPSAATPCTGETGSSLVCDHTSGSALPCQEATLNAVGCPNGVCLREWNLAGEWRRQRQIVDRIRSISANTKIIFVLPADTCQDGCGAITACAAGTCVGCWGEAAEFLGAQRNFYKKLATEVSGNWIDVNAEFRRRCSPWPACLRDAVHSSISANGDNPTGNDVVADLMTACLEDTEGDATNTSCANR